MSAVLRDERLLLPLTTMQLDAVVAIEKAAYPFPWTRGNFVDSLAAGYFARVLYGSQGEMLGYFIAMEGVDEMHLLNLTIEPSAQGRGHALFMLDELRALCRSRQSRELWLEVRPSNERARKLYQRFGFAEIRVRRDYYPADRSTHPGGREDALVMVLAVGDDHVLG